MFLCVLMHHNVVFSLPHLRGRLFVSCLSTYWSICLCFSWLLFKTTYPKQTCGSFTLHSIIPEIDIFQCSGEQKLCAVFHGTVMHLWKLGEDTFLLYIGEKKLVVCISQIWSVRGKNHVPLLLLSVLCAAGSSGGVCSGQQLKGHWDTGMRNDSGGKSCH